eukprot:CAMPEP_0114237332 /NCGR_PEP_ID=MMETSP0058-20121206/7329_1 /TAXON_ID=36894 /ORGANISM="Pyramimonas parkeae, CCMP726" /LENGTH=114 /DNA_ID=CAMNT_0001349357 /DNA_START=1008 /DNA_END=1349 /DNA_ORIENTATION=+
MSYNEDWIAEQLLNPKDKGVRKTLVTKKLETPQQTIDISVKHAPSETSVETQVQAEHKSEELAWGGLLAALSASSVILPLLNVPAQPGWLDRLQIDARWRRARRDNVGRFVCWW